MSMASCRYVRVVSLVFFVHVHALGSFLAQSPALVKPQKIPPCPDVAVSLVLLDPAHSTLPLCWHSHSCFPLLVQLGILASCSDELGKGKWVFSCTAGGPGW